MPRTVAIIPARGGSKGIPQKNLALLEERPLIAWTIETAKKSGILKGLICCRWHYTNVFIMLKSQSQRSALQ